MAIDSQHDLRPDAAKRFSKDDTHFALGRIAAFQYFIAAVFLFLISGFWVLQVRDGESNSQLAERNRVKTVPVLAPRGTLLVTRENLTPDHIDGIAAGLHLDKEELRARIKRFSSRPKYVPVMIKQELTPAEISFVESHRDSDTYPEMELIQNQRRLYPRNGFAAHAVGYVGEVSEQELDTPEFAKYSQGEVVGKAGLER